MRQHLIAGVVQGSIAQELSIEAGDVLLEINHEKIEDVLDYQFLSEDTYLEVLIRKADGGEWLLEIDKDEDEDLGIVFENAFMDGYKRCCNKCVFCFIDQMPPGMRDTLYFKDDDSRLSFLQGNYVTLTNLSEKDVKRLIRYRMEPINISFHTTEEALRCEMLGNKHAGSSLKKAKMLYDAGIRMNGQIVLCKGLNDGDHLKRTIADLSTLMPYLSSVSVVPVGLTKYREGLYPLAPFEKDDATKVLRTVCDFQKRLFADTGNHFIHASDEWYMLAGCPFPDEETYDDYPQLENGVGMIPLLMHEVKKRLLEIPGDEAYRVCSIATGTLAAPFIETCAGWIKEQFPNTSIRIYPITNHFFGERITVSGLITGRDIIEQLTDSALGECLLIPCNMLKADEAVFLDDITLSELQLRLHIDVRVVEEEGACLVDGILGITQETSRRRNRYEQTGCSDCGTPECGKIDPV